MRRLMRDAEQREFAALEKADLERRRLMTDKLLNKIKFFYFFKFFQPNLNFIFTLKINNKII